MIRIHNTTSIPDKLIHIAVAQGIQEGVSIDTIIVRNKKKDHITGNWGKYHNKHHQWGRCITLVVPQKLDNFKDHRHYAGNTVVVQDRTEFMILVMAHELRHAYQYQIQGISHLDYRRNKYRYEKDAENWEYVCLLKWRQFVSNLQCAATDSR